MTDIIHAPLYSQYVSYVKPQYEICDKVALRLKRGMGKEDKVHSDIGTRLKAFRELTELQQKEFAIKNGFAPTQYTNWETGERRIPVDKAALLENVYGLTLDFIYLGRFRTLPHSLATSLSEKLKHNLTNKDN